jgi:hypothetical protein
MVGILRQMSLGDDFKHFGYGRTLLARAYRALESLGVQVLLINSRRLDPAAPEPSLPAGHAIRYLECADLPQIERHADLNISRQFAEAAFARGDCCIGYFAGNALVSYFWCSFAEAPMVPGLTVQVPKGYSYAYKALTLASHRGQHLQERLTHASDRALTARGLHSNIEYMAAHNLAQRSASARYGNRTLGHALLLRAMGRRRVLRSPGARRIGFEVVSATR